MCRCRTLRHVGHKTHLRSEVLHSFDVIMFILNFKSFQILQLHSLENDLNCFKLMLPLLLIRCHQTDDLIWIIFLMKF